jgi:hypothetical protein
MPDVLGQGSLGSPLDILLKQQADPTLQKTKQDILSSGQTLEDTQRRKQEEIAPLAQNAITRAQDVATTAANVPEPAELPTPPKAPSIDTSQLAGVFMTLIAAAALGAKSSSRPMYAALNNMNGALQGFIDGRQETFNNHMAEFRANFEVAKAKHSKMRQEYLDTLNSKKLSLEAMQQQLRITAAKYEDESSLAMLRMHNLEEFLKLQESSNKAYMDAVIKSETLADRGQMAALRMQLLRNQISGNPAMELDDETADFMAEQYIATPDNSIFTSLGRGIQGARNVIKLRTIITTKVYNKYHLTPAEIAARGILVIGEKAAARAAGTRAAQVGLAASEAQKTFNIVREKSANLPRTDFPAINEVLKAAETNAGDYRWIALGQAINTSVNAYARAVTPTGVPTERSRERAFEHLKDVFNPEQLEAALQVMEQEMNAAVQAPMDVQEQQRERITRKGKVPDLSEINAELKRRGVKP